MDWGTKGWDKELRVLRDVKGWIVEMIGRLFGGWGDVG